MHNRIVPFCKGTVFGPPLVRGQFKRDRSKADRRILKVDELSFIGQQFASGCASFGACHRSVEIGPRGPDHFCKPVKARRRAADIPQCRGRRIVEAMNLMIGGKAQSVSVFFDQWPMGATPVFLKFLPGGVRQAAQAEC